MSHGIDTISQSKTILDQALTHPQLVAVAVSGGPDSMCLLEIVKNYYQQKNRDLALIHVLVCHHHTRPEIEKEIELVQKASSGLVVNIFDYRGDKFDEQSLRTWRHHSFAHYCKEYAIKRLLTGHHLDDRIESTLLNMRRGAALKGIKSITAFDPHFLDSHITIVRPLIHLSKSQILNFNRANHISFAHDITNDNPHYSERNQIRQVLNQYFATPQRYKSFEKLYQELEQLNDIQVETVSTLPLIPGTEYDITSIGTTFWTKEHLIAIYQHYEISINPRSTTLEQLVKQLNARSGSKISYCGLTIRSYRYASTIKLG